MREKGETGWIRVCGGERVDNGIGGMRGYGKEIRGIHEMKRKDSFVDL